MANSYFVVLENCSFTLQLFFFIIYFAPPAGRHTVGRLNDKRFLYVPQRNVWYASAKKLLFYNLTKRTYGTLLILTGYLLFYQPNVPMEQNKFCTYFQHLKILFSPKKVMLAFLQPHCVASFKCTQQPQHCLSYQADNIILIFYFTCL